MDSLRRHSAFTAPAIGFMIEVEKYLWWLATVSVFLLLMPALLMSIFIFKIWNQTRFKCEDVKDLKMTGNCTNVEKYTDFVHGACQVGELKNQILVLLVTLPVLLLILFTTFFVSVCLKAERVDRRRRQVLSAEQSVALDDSHSGGVLGRPITP